MFENAKLPLKDHNVYYNDLLVTSLWKHVNTLTYEENICFSSKTTVFLHHIGVMDITITHRLHHRLH